MALMILVLTDRPVAPQVFDVSKKKMFYGKNGVYSVFAGRDATKAFAKNSLDEKDLDVEE